MTTWNEPEFVQATTITEESIRDFQVQMGPTFAELGKLQKLLSQWFASDAFEIKIIRSSKLMACHFYCFWLLHLDYCQDQPVRKCYDTLYLRVNLLIIHMVSDYYS